MTLPPYRPTIWHWIWRGVYEVVKVWKTRKQLAFVLLFHPHTWQNQLAHLLPFSTPTHELCMFRQRPPICHRTRPESTNYTKLFLNWVETVTMCTNMLHAVHDHRVSGISYSDYWYVCEDADHEDSLQLLILYIYIYMEIFAAKCCILYKLVWTLCLMHRCVYLTVHITKWCWMMLVSMTSSFIGFCLVCF